MTKIIRESVLAILVLACAFVMALAGCSGNKQDSAYTVTIDYNYSGSTSVVLDVAVGDTLDVPDDPLRDGNSIFSGWYEDAACTVSFDFSAPITSDTTIYAGWTEIKDGYVAVIYMWNYDGAGTYKVETMKSGDPLNDTPTPERESYRFRGWYKEAECINEQLVEFIDSNITLYALWYYGYVFEAEYTDLTDEEGDMRTFHGYSQNANPVLSDVNASNGYYLGNMYINECYIYFEIMADDDIDNAMMYLTCAMDFGWELSSGKVTFSSDNYRITVNDETINYSDMVFDVSKVKDGYKTDFLEFFIGNIKLTEGSNLIRLEVCNSIHGQGGSQDGMAPVVDCMTIYSGVSLSWTPVESNLNLAY